MVGVCEITFCRFSQMPSCANQLDFFRVLIKKDARMIRDLRLIAYFRQCLPRDLDISSHQELVHSLASIPPCEVPLPRIKVQHLHCQVRKNILLYPLMQLYKFYYCSLHCFSYPNFCISTCSDYPLYLCDIIGFLLTSRAENGSIGSVFK